MRRSFTFLEAMVSTGILMILLLGAGQLMQTMQVSTQTVAKVVDIDRDARNALSLLAADIRQTGWTWDNSTSTNLYRGPADSGTPVQGTSRFTDTDSATSSTLPVLSMRLRTGFAANVEQDFQRWVTWEVVQDGTFTGVPGTPTRYLLRRVETFDTDFDGLTAETAVASTIVVENLSRVSFERIGAGTEGPEAIDVRLELSRINPDRRQASPPALRWLYRERVRMQNRPEDRS